MADFNNKEELKKYAFEYNEDEGIFHQNFGDYKQNTKGYKTVYIGLESIWDPFRRFIHKCYTFGNGNKPTFMKVIQLFDWYIELRKDISSYYEREN